MTDNERELLPSTVRPIRHDLTLAPDLSTFTFEGKQTIDVEVLTSTSTIVMHSAEIEVGSTSLTLDDGTTLTPESIDYDTDLETVTLSFAEELQAGPARLSMSFTGELNDRLRGFYRSRYLDDAGNERHLATTQFEATDARRAFPCWDEPSWKAAFKTTLVVPSELVALSNMHVESESAQADGRKAVSFAETPVMSTYILAFVVGDLRSIEEQAPDGTLMRIWSTPGKEEHGRFALETSIRLLAYFNEYFGIPYPLQKMDHLAIPDFAAGAMENWGAITYRESALLVDPENSSSGTRQIVASIIAHEMAHMWFGDLVTMAWWNDLWLNESFASWMGDKAVNDLFPEWQMWTQFLSADTNRALSLDGLTNSHPIEQEVANPAQIQQMFDDISYSKGASIIRMLEGFLGSDAFREGLRAYLREHEYGNAETRDLWKSLAEASGQPVSSMMDTWTAQMGYPVLDVTADRSDDGVSVHLSQKRFVYESILGGGDDDDSAWSVPVGAIADGADEPAFALMDGREATVRLSASARPAWVKINPEQTGFYRVNYQDDDLTALIGPIERGELSPSDRLGIQNDAYALARAGLAPVTRFLSIAPAYRNEDTAPVASDLAVNLAGLDSILSEEPYHAKFQAYARDIFAPIGRRMGWEPHDGEGHLDALLRSTVLEALGRYEDSDTLTEAAAKLQRYVTDSSSVPPDLRRAVYSLAAKQGDGTTWETMWGLYKDSPLQEEKVRLLMGLTQFKSRELLSQTLDRALSEDVRTQDAPYPILGTGMNAYGRDLAWDYLKENWEEIDRRYGEGGFMIMRLVSFTSGFTSEEKRQDVEKFFADHPAPAAERSIRQALERISLNIAWLDRNRSELAARFAG